MTTHNRSKKVNRAWLHDHINDPYVKLAQKEGYRSRAAYKLKEIDESLRLIKAGQLVVDLGSAPGAWSQYVSRKFTAARGRASADPASAATGRIIALDMLPMEAVEGVHFHAGDFRETSVCDELRTLLAGRRIDVLLSDMAPNLSGVAEADGARMTDLVELAIAFAQEHLSPQGALLCKAFHGSGYSQLAQSFKNNFKTFKAVKPKASRDKSAETYLVGVGLKSLPNAAKLRT
ncbi:MAG: RlmE family RNA methyltransferase [Burkholderiaceae bacterium]